MPEAPADNDVKFVTHALGAHDLFLSVMDGREAISELFEFHVRVQTVPGVVVAPDHVSAILDERAYLAFGEAEEHKIHGIVRSVELASTQEAEGPFSFDMVLVPRLWRLTRSFRSRVFHKMTVAEVVKSILQEYNFREGDDFDFAQVTERYNKREYVVQYQETDFHFIARLLEDEGIFYFFEHGDDAEKIVFADSNNAFVEPADHGTIHFTPIGGGDHEDESLTSFAMRTQMSPGRAIARDYDYATPGEVLMHPTNLRTVSPVDRIFYGDYFKDEDGENRGDWIARIREEEQHVNDKTFTGHTTVRALRSGQKFTLADYTLQDLDGDYVVTSLTHSVEQSGSSGSDGGSSGGGYQNAVTVIPAQTPFRPARVTPKPRITGVTTAVVDGPANGTPAPIDEQGRYKVVLPFEAYAKHAGVGGRDSRWIRMAQPYSGPNYGFHFPLHEGVEVLLVHIDGDPDRPLIVGAVPNARMHSTVTKENATQSVIRTRSQILVEFEDDAEAGGAEG